MFITADENYYKKTRSLKHIKLLKITPERHVFHQQHINSSTQ